MIWPMRQKDRPDDDSFVAPAAWAGVTLALTVVSLTLDPVWAYYGAWAAGFMTAYAVMARAIRLDKQPRLDSEDEALLLEVQQAKTEGESPSDEGTSETAPQGRLDPFPPGVAGYFAVRHQLGR